MRNVALSLSILVALAIPAAAVSGRDDTGGFQRGHADASGPQHAGGPHHNGLHTTCVFTTQLAAAHEIGGSTSTASGHTQIKIWSDATLQFKTHILNPAGESFVAGHVHNAPVGVNGAIVVPLFGGPATSDHHIVQTGHLSIDSALATAICTHPENYYVNYHTAANPGGAIRGQLG